MTGETMVAVAFLSISGMSLTWQTTALYQLLRLDAPRGSPAYRGLLRTSICRVCVSVCYVMVGGNALFTHVSTLAVTFTVFCITQIVWQLNAAADVRLSRRLPTAENTEETAGDQ